MQILYRKIIALFQLILNRISVLTLVASLVVTINCRNTTITSDVSGDRNGNGGDRNGNGDLTGLSTSNHSSIGVVKIVDANTTAKEIKDEWRRRALIVLEKSREYLSGDLEKNWQDEKDLIKKNGFWRASPPNSYTTIISPLESYNLTDLPVKEVINLRAKNPDCNYWDSNSLKPANERPSDFLCRLEEAIDVNGIEVEIDLNTRPKEDPNQFQPTTFKQNFYQTTFARFMTDSDSHGKIVIYRKNWNQIITTEDALVQFDQFLNELVAHTYFTALGKDDRLTIEFQTNSKTRVRNIYWPLTRTILATPYFLYNSNFSGNEQCTTEKELFTYLDYLRRVKPNWKKYLERTSENPSSRFRQSPELIARLKMDVPRYNYNQFNQIFRPETTQEQQIKRERESFYDIWRDINFLLPKEAPEVKHEDIRFEQTMFMMDIETWFGNDELPHHQQANFTNNFYSNIAGYLCRISCNKDKRCGDIIWHHEQEGAP